MAIEKVQIGDATLYRGDALAVLQELDTPVDALITDPPYSSGGLHRSDRAQPAGRKYVSSGFVGLAHNVDFTGDHLDARSWAYWMTLWMSAARDHLKSGAYVMVFTDWRQLPACTDVFQGGGFVWRGLIPWDKTQASRAPHKGYFRHQCEYVVWGTNGPCHQREDAGPFPGFITKRVVAKEKLHMTGKPVEVMEGLVAACTPGGVVFDPFMGSASTGVAALQSGRKFIGVEKSPHYFDVACRRLEALSKAL